MKRLLAAIVAGMFALAVTSPVIAQDKKKDEKAKTAVTKDEKAKPAAKKKDEKAKPAAKKKDEKAKAPAKKKDEKATGAK